MLTAGPGLPATTSSLSVGLWGAGVAASLPNTRPRLVSVALPPNPRAVHATLDHVSPIARLLALTGSLLLLAPTTGTCRPG